MTTVAEQVPPFDASQLRTLVPSNGDLAGKYSGNEFRQISRSNVRTIDATSPAFVGAEGLVGGIEQVVDAYNPYYQSDTTVIFRAVLFRTRADASRFVASYDQPSRVDNVTTRDAVAVSTFEYAQAGSHPSVAESMSATGFVVIWVKIVDSDPLSIYTGVAYLIVEDAVTQAIDEFGSVARGR